MQMLNAMLPAALVAAGFTTLVAFQGVDPSTLPDDQGKALLSKECAECHDLSVVTGKRLTVPDWKNMVDDMIARGVQAEEGDAQKLATYLSAHVGRVNVNRASADDIKTVLGFSDAEAAALVKARSGGTTFQTVDDVKKVPGIDPKKVDERKDAVVFSDR